MPGGDNMSKEIKATLMFLFPGIIFIKGTSIGIYKNENDYTIIECEHGNILFEVTAVSLNRRGEILIFYDGTKTTVFNCKNIHYRILDSVVMYRAIGDYKVIFNYKEAIVFYNNEVIVDCEFVNVKINEKDINFPLSIEFKGNRKVTFDKYGNEMNPIDVICSRMKFKDLYRENTYFGCCIYVGVDNNNFVYKYDNYGIPVNNIGTKYTKEQIDNLLNRFKDTEVIIRNGKILQR